MDLVKHDGDSAEYTMMKFLKKLWKTTEPFPLHEGKYADEYTSEETKEFILKKYRERYEPKITPQSHPEKFNPLSPPKNWRYDPFYELWVETKTHE